MGEVEGICNPIITKLYQAAGGAPGGMPGGMPPGAGGMPGAGAPPVQDPDPLSKRSTNVLFWITNPTNNRKSADFFFKPEMLVDLFTFDHQFSPYCVTCGEQTIMS